MEGRKKIGGEIPKSLETWALATLILAAIAPVSSIDDKCGACNAVAGELEIGLSKEKPRNHLDMRHRLDSRGQREGKVIDYRLLEETEDELAEWIKRGSVRPGGVSKALCQDLSKHCSSSSENKVV
ncbi:protein canopy-1 [Cocos nucifera]|nr:protein canopy-1 [Cocos nucifera]